MKIRWSLMAALILVCLLFSGKPLHAQANETSNAKLTGVLTDPSGAVVSGAIGSGNSFERSGDFCD